MSTTTFAAVAKSKLSCNHVQEVGEHVAIGDRITCERCDRPRRVKTLRPLAQPEAPADPAMTPVPDPTPEAVLAVSQFLAGQITAEQATAVVRTPAQPETESDTGYDPVLAAAEHRALTAWIKGGKQGDRPDTTNLDRLNAAHAAGRPRSGRKPSGSKAPKRVTSERRAKANALKAAANNKRGAGTKISEDELVAYVRKVRADHPTSSREDELEVAYWVEQLAVSRQRFYNAWAAASA